MVCRARLVARSRPGAERPNDRTWDLSVRREPDIWVGRLVARQVERLGHEQVQARRISGRDDFEVVCVDERTDHWRAFVHDESRQIEAAVAHELRPVPGGGHDAIGQGGESLIATRGRDEDVDVEIDRASCLLGAPRQRQGAAKGVIQSGIPQVLMDGEHLVRKAAGLAAHARLCPGSGGNRSRLE